MIGADVWSAVVINASAKEVLLRHALSILRRSGSWQGARQDREQGNVRVLGGSGKEVGEGVEVQGLAHLAPKEVEAAIGDCGAEPGEVRVANLGAKAVGGFVARAGVVNRDPGGRHTHKESDSPPLGNLIIIPPRLLPLLLQTHITL